MESGVSRLKELESSVLTYKKYNSLADIFDLIKGKADDKDLTIAAVQVLKKIFVVLAERQDHGFQLIPKAVDSEQEETSSSAQVRKFLETKLTHYVSFVVKLLHHTDVNIQTFALRSLMALVKRQCQELTASHKQATFAQHTFQQVILAMVNSETLSAEVLELLIHNYVTKFGDVRLYTFKCLKLAISKRRERLRTNETAEDEEEAEDVDMEDTESPNNTLAIAAFCRNVYDFLANLPDPSNVENIASMIASSEEKKKPEKPAHDSKQKGKRKEKKEANNMKSHQRAFSDCWLAFLSMPLPQDIYKKILLRLHKNILPYITDPLRLSDFLTDSYNIGGIVSVLALSGLFILITKHHLDYPDFYKKLYALLDESIFTVKYRARFLKLLDLSLKSTLMPAYVVASFIKKLARLSIRLPPSGCLWVIPFLYNLFRRHPSCIVMIHKPIPGGSVPVFEAPKPSTTTFADFITALADNLNKDTEPTPESTPAPAPIEKKDGPLIDPFIESETDPAKTNALESSLWEVGCLKRHYCGSVSRLAAIFETQFTKMQAEKYELDDFVSLTFQSLFEQELNRKTKSVPLAFSEPKSLFSDTDPFQSWSFE